MGSVTRLLCATVLAGLLGACALPRQGAVWPGDAMFGVTADGREYGDFLTARYAGLIGDAPAAAVYYRRAFEHAPNDPAALEAAVLAQMLDGDAAAAATIATGASSSVVRDSPAAQLAIVVDEIARGRPGRARDRLASARMGAFNAELADFLGAWLIAQTSPMEGLRKLDERAAGRGQGAETSVVRAMILASSGQHAEALAELSQAPRLPAASAFQIALHARLLAIGGDTAGARDLIRQYEDLSGPQPETSHLAALIDSGERIAPPRFTMASGAAASIHISATGRFSRLGGQVAIMRHSLALHADPGFDTARLALARALSEQSRHDAAISVLRSAPASSPLLPSMRIALARSLVAVDDGEAALTYVAEATARSQQRDVLLGAGDIYRRLDRFAEAEASYTAVAEQDAAQGRVDWRVLFARASARQRQDRWADAEADLLAALAVEPRRPELLNFLGYGWVDRGERVEEGLDLLRTAAASRPDAGYIIDSLGWAYFRLGDYDRAVEYLERATELSPDDPEIIDHLGDAYWRRGRLREAEFQWRRALQFSPRPELEARVKAKLVSGLPDDGPRSAGRSQP